MKTAFIIVAVILFVFDALMWWVSGPEPGYRGRATPLGLAFFAASFLSLVPG